MSGKRRHVSETPATAWLRRHGVAFSEHVYDYVDRGGTAESARQLGVEEHLVVKTLVMEDDGSRPLIVLMHGDRSVSTKTLARAIDTKRLQPCAPDVAERHSGYQVGGRRHLAVRHAEAPADLRRGDDPRARDDLRERRAPRLSRGDRADGVDDGARRRAGALRRLGNLCTGRIGLSDSR